MIGSENLFEILVRWAHLVAGVLWIGLLYFFNVVNVPFMKALDADTRGKVVPELLPRALWWFRYGALVTALSGLVLIISHSGMMHGEHGHGGLFTTSWGKTILVGGGLGMIMFLNVWLVIWPNQKRIIEAVRSKQAPQPQWGKQALLASRTNAVLSLPMLFFMAAASHFLLF